MDNEIQTWLYDILQSINEIDSYYENKPRIFREYVSDIKTKRAIERNLEIIGEAVNYSACPDNRDPVLPQSGTSCEGVGGVIRYPISIKAAC